MKRKSLLFLLLMAVFAPWAANAQQTLPVYEDETATNNFVPFKGYDADSPQHNQMIYPSTVLTDMVGKEITQMVFYLTWTSNSQSPGNWIISLGETTATTLSGLDNTTTLTQVYSGTMVYDATVSPITMTITFENGYTYNGGNLLVDFNHPVAGGWRTISFIGKEVTGAAYSYNSVRNFLPRVTFSYQAPPCCPKPTNLACTGYTATTATFTWTNGGEETQWLLEYATDNNFTNPTQVTVNQSDLVNGEYTLDNNLTGEQKYYGRIKAVCPSCDPNYSDWSNTCEFKPSAVVFACEDFESVTNPATGYSSGTDNLPDGWDIIPTTGDYRPRVVTNAASYTPTGWTGNRLAMIAGSSASIADAYAILPEHSDVSGIKFNAWRENASNGTLDFGYVTDASDGSTFHSLMTNVNPNPLSSLPVYSSATINNTLVEIDITSIPDNARLAFKWSYNSSWYTVHIDNVCVGSIPTPTPKPKNVHIVDGSLSSTGVTLAWEAPASATPTGYEYQYKTSTGEWPTAWTSNGTNLSVPLSGLTSGTPYNFRVRANYAEGNSDPKELENGFTTLDDCAFPTNLLAYTVPGQGTKATLTWVKGYDEEAWVLQYGTDPNFTDGTYTEKTSGFIPQTEPGLENVVAAVLTGLTPETKYYARVMATCSATSSSTWSNVADFTPTNFVDYTFGETPYSTVSSVPFYGYYANYGTLSQFIIPAAQLADVAGGTIRRLTFYSSTATASWGDAVFEVYVKEVEASSFASANAEGLEDWTTMTNVYSGSLSVINSQMVIELDHSFSYNGGNLMIGFNEATPGSSSSVSWRYVQGPSNSALYAYKTSSSGSLNYYRNIYLPRITFNYQPTPYQKIAAINEGTITTNTAELTWTAPETTATITGYAYQYKLSSAAEWPTAWSNLAASATSVTLQPLTPGTSYDFQIKVLYGEHESAVNSTSFFTECAIVTAFPWSEKFEGYPANTSTSYSETYKFNNPCWLNVHLVDGTGSSGTETWFQVYSGTTADNNTKRLQLPDMKDGTQTELRLPEMTLATGTNYQFVIDVYRDNNSKANEGIRIYASADGNIAGAQELGFIPHYYNYEPIEAAIGWNTYEFAIPFTGTCYIIIVGESKYGTATYMDNLSVEEIPTCARPSDLAKSEVTNHSATLTWTAGDTGQSLWQIAYSKTEFDPNTASFDITTVSTVDATANPFKLDKILDAESTYYVYVRANCGTATEPDYGPWSRKGISFTTLAASPAPSNFTASNFGSQTADLVWTAGGGDYELSWDLYYVQSDDAPTAPTEETPATKTVTTLPTTENPYTLDELAEESRYYIWVRANHTINSVTTHSAWVALTGNYFTTLAACPTPTGLAYNNLTAVSADLSWVGSPDVTDYTVQYRTSATPTTNSLFFEGFETYADEAALEAVWTVIDLGDGANTAELGLYDGAAQTDDYGFRFSSYSKASTTTYPYTSDDFDQYLISPELTVNGVLKFSYKSSNGTTDFFRVGYSSTTNDLSAFTWGEQINSANSWKDFSETIPAGTKYFAINYMGLYAHRLYIDDINIYETNPAGEWITAANDVTTQSYQITGLTGGIKYDTHVKSNCTSGEYCPEISFTTLADGTKVFVTAGEWGTATNWMPNGAPVITDEVILRANATIENNCVAQAKKITFQGSPTPTLTINDGGQLQTDNTVTATVKKNIEHWTVEGVEGSDTEKPNGYYFISNPLNSTIYSSSFASIGLITTNSDYDLYRWSTGEGADYLEWRNFKALSFNLQGGGYLYANAADVVLTFTGTVRANNERSGWTPTQASYSFGNWNLYGNPFVCNAYLVNSNNISKPYYKMNEAGDGFEAVIGEAIPPVTGLFYDASESGESVFFTRDLPAKSNQGHLNINMAQNVNMRGAKGSTDNAIIVFGESQQMGKFSFREGSSKVYIPMEGKDYAVVNAGKTGEIPVNFKAEKNGSYSLSFTSQEVTFSYLHLIDNLTGNDVDLLANPNYSFEAQTTDYASRFRLVFAVGSSVDGDSFGFINGSGNLCIFGIEGEATIQVIDILGHVITSDTFSGSYERKLNVAPGVYMIRLINGNDVKVQKMIVK